MRAQYLAVYQNLKKDSQSIGRMKEAERFGIRMDVAARNDAVNVGSSLALKKSLKKRLLVYMVSTLDSMFCRRVVVWGSILFSLGFNGAAKAGADTPVKLSLCQKQGISAMHEPKGMKVRVLFVG
jgi:hypothetical protein